ncbi:hypothetical protein O7635_26375 [Asanoa sp. WMMD1127]|uniref:hypothetical protein n=1 Tax=Asanoa sp. WMMD1127 TaxID=3016107 RepID=UPI0024169B00|nr:hypothetical protein [Asanoa sp. WMMD1127]MDG4825388.1 hypothetical protein [Asanoa sp. WMMD1127]
MTGHDPAAEFFAGLPPQRRADAEAVHDLIRAAAPRLTPWIWRGVMWGGTDQTILGYGRIAQTNRGGATVEWFRIGLAYLSLYVSATRDGRYLAQVYGPRLGKAKIGSSALSFRRLADLDRSVLTELVAEAARPD